MVSEEPTNLSRLDSLHRDALSRAVHNILETNLALNFYAQLIDRLPTADVAWDQRIRRTEPSHPVNQHSELCPGSLNKAKDFRDGFSTEQLSFELELLNAFNTAPASSKAFNLRLIELVSSALHQIAVFLFQQSEKLHKPSTTEGLDIKGVTRWERPPDQWHRFEPWPTLFIHPSFTAHQQYPNGIADIAGYWIEDRVLSSVAMFDRSRTWSLEDEPNTYFQSCRSRTTYRAWQLLKDQQAQLVSFLLDKDPDSTSCPLPILPSSANRVRVDSADAIPVHKIYRNPWEREPPQPRLRMMEDREPCVRNPLDYPEMEDVQDEIARMNRT